MLAGIRATLAGLPSPPAYLSGVECGTQYAPGTNPAKFVRVRRSGGVAINLVEDAARLDYQVWYETGAPTDVGNRMALAQLVRGIVYSLTNAVVDGVRIGQSAEFIGPGRFPDPNNSNREIILFTIETRLRAIGA